MDHASSKRSLIPALLLAAGALFLASDAWFVLAGATMGPMTHRAVLGGLALFAIAFVPLGRLAKWRPWAPLRIALGTAVVLSILDAMSMPAPPGPESISSFAAFFVLLLFAVTAHLLAEPRPRLAFVALVGLAVFGIYFGYAVDYYATSSRFGSVAKYNAWPVAVIAAACLAACWYGRALLSDRPAAQLGR